MTEVRTVTITAPAKINLGMEILGKRPDGYHEIRTVMAMVDLADTLAISPTVTDPDIRIEGMRGVAPEDNLITRAVREFSEVTGNRTGYRIKVRKKIPSPGGLGGASSDAAATLMALNALHDAPLASGDVLHIGSGLGSDVPFFLGSSFALASGTGTTLLPLPPIAGWAVLVIPELSIAAKTPTLYRALQAEDFSSGSKVDEVTSSISRHELPDPDTLRNAFTRPLYELAPELRDVSTSMLLAGAPHVALSGAGPAHYALLASEAEAEALASRLKAILTPKTVVRVTRLLTVRPPLEINGR